MRVLPALIVLNQLFAVVRRNGDWFIASRDKSGKHKNVYHGNFIPQNRIIKEKNAKK
ncbi:MAG: hypothetical protein LUC34_04790 [Campylobacter sp.]|nr:hypothetical protein [Campylobacter sp.]